MDQALTALIEDLENRGLDQRVLVLLAGEFGRTPRIRMHMGVPGRDHWGAVQTAVFAGAGTATGHVIGASDRIGGYPIADPQTPENLGATIYRALGLPSTVAWHDKFNRPHQVYHDEPIEGLL